MNPTKPLIDYYNSFLEKIPKRFIEITIDDNYQSASLKIRNSICFDNIFNLETKKGLISVDYFDTFKKFYCNRFNYKKQIEKSLLCLLDSNSNRPKLPKIPILEKNQFSLALCGPATGQVFEIETLKVYIGWGEIYRIFNSFEESIEFVKKFEKTIDIECRIYDHNNDCKETLYVQKGTFANTQLLPSRGDSNFEREENNNPFKEQKQ
jgi:hypothetical protein